MYTSLTYKVLYTFVWNSIPYPSPPCTRLEDRVNKVLRSSPASLPWHEKDIRLLHRFTFLIPSRTDQEYSYWMTQILKPWPITFQARLLYLLTGPEDANGERADHQYFHLVTLLVARLIDHYWPYTLVLYSWPAYCLIAGFVSWTQACGCSSLEHTSGSVDFSELGRALKVLRTHRPQDWSEDDIISIIDELTSKPHLDSLHLTYFCLPVKPFLNHISCCM